jgi:hypothetical protein
MAALIGDERTKLSAEEIRQLRELLANARKGGNK